MAAIGVEVRFQLRVFEKARLPCGNVFKGLGIHHPRKSPEKPLDDEGIGAQTQLQAIIARFESHPGVARAAFHLAIVGALFFWNRVQVFDEA